MKKYFILISAAVLALSCAKELVDNQEVSGKDLKTITFESVMTKTTVTDEGAVAWEKGDEISIYYLDAQGKAATAVATATSAGKEATFTAQIPKEDNPTEYYAAYPKETGVMDPSTGKFYLNIKNGVCDGTFKSANFSASYTSAEAMSLQFHNAVGMIRLAVPEGGKFTKDGVEYTLTGVYLRGQVKAFSDKNNNGPVEFNAVDATFGEPVDLTVGETGYGDGVANINLPNLSSEALASGYVYIPSLPGTWPTGLCIRYIANFEDVKKGYLPAVLSQATPVEIVRGEVLKLSDQTANVHMNYYVSSTGEGNGLTEATPMSFAKMQEMIDLTDDGMFGAYTLQRVTFNILDGEHTLTSTINVPNASTPYSMTIKGVSGGSTILNGGGSVGVILVGHNVHLYLSNLQIKNGKATGWGGLKCDWGDKATDSNAIIDCDNCWFNANQSTSVGAAVRVNDNAAGGLVRFNSCSFTDNKSLNGGGAASYNGPSAAAVMFNKCSFNGNTGTKDGICIYSGTSQIYKARLALNNCTINPTSGSFGTNGAAVSTTGYNVIANTTIWSEEGLGKRGLIAMGLNKTYSEADDAGSAIINCFLHNNPENANEYKSFWVHAKYYQNIKYCMYSGITENTASGYTLDYVNEGSFDYSSLGAVPEKNTDNKEINTIQHYAYKWTWTDAYKSGMNPKTVEEVNAEIEAVPNIGPLFMNWLETIPGSLDTDIYGVSRTPASCPGSYQQTSTPAGV